MLLQSFRANLCENQICHVISMAVGSQTEWQNEKEILIAPYNKSWYYQCYSLRLTMSFEWIVPNLLDCRWSVPDCCDTYNYIQSYADARSRSLFQYAAPFVAPTTFEQFVFKSSLSKPDFNRTFNESSLIACTISLNIIRSVNIYSLSSCQWH